MIQPVRIQLSRAKGFNLQEYSKSINGLPCKKIDRTTKWGNPIRLFGDMIYIDAGYRRTILSKYVLIHSNKSNIEEVLFYYEHIICGYNSDNPDLQWWSDYYKIVDFSELKGYNLACWCKKSEKCHGDILLKKICEKQ